MNTSSDWSDRCYGYAPVHLEYCCNTPCMFPPPATSRTAWATSYRPTVSEEPCYLWPIRRLRSPFAPESKREADQSSKRTALFILKNSRNLTHTYLRFGHFHSSVLKHCNRFEEKCTNMRNMHTLVRVHTHTHICMLFHACTKHLFYFRKRNEQYLPWLWTFFFLFCSVNELLVLF